MENFDERKWHAANDVEKKPGLKIFPRHTFTIKFDDHIVLSEVTFRVFLANVTSAEI